MHKREINELNTVLELRCCINFGKSRNCNKSHAERIDAALTDILPNPETLAAVPGWTASSCSGRFTNPILRDGLNGEYT